MKHLTFTENDRVFFSSDFHAFHMRDFVWQSRGYSSPEEHTNGLITKINETVGEDDHLFNLGDFVLNASRENFEELIGRLKCKNIYYIWGNHNSRVTETYQETVKNCLGDLYQDGMEVYPLRYKNIVFVGHYLEITVNKQFIAMCHYPMSSWNYMSHGNWMVFGHSHSKVDTALGKSIDVGIDLHGKPISFNELKILMDKKQIKNEGHHISKLAN